MRLKIQRLIWRRGGAVSNRVGQLSSWLGRYINVTYYYYYYFSEEATDSRGDERYVARFKYVYTLINPGKHINRTSAHDFGICLRTEKEIDCILFREFFICLI